MKTNLLLISILLGGALLTACGGDGDKDNSHSSINSSSVSSSSSLASSSEQPGSSAGSSSVPTATKVKLSVTITNLTAGQPLSPTAVTLHNPLFKAFEVGTSASLGLEHIAESGNSDAFLADANVNAAVLTTGKASGGIAPGTSASIILEAMVDDTAQAMLRLTVLSMLGNTNDGFTGLNGIDVSQLAVGHSWVIDTLSYDAGTEENSESAATVPGPAAEGEGFNTVRDDPVSTVAMHLGPLTRANGNHNSALTGIHRWDNPVARITIARLEP